jgi:hypothetical protein
MKTISNGHLLEVNIYISLHLGILFKETTDSKGQGEVLRKVEWD